MRNVKYCVCLLNELTEEPYYCNYTYMMPSEERMDYVTVQPVAPIVREVKVPEAGVASTPPPHWWLGFLMCCHPDVSAK